MKESWAVFKFGWDFNKHDVIKNERILELVACDFNSEGDALLHIEGLLPRSGSYVIFKVYER